MIIPLEELSADAVQGLVDEFCTRDNGCNETEEPLEQCRHAAENALRQGRLVVVYTPFNPNQAASLVPVERLEE